jgi:hypothetical protein
MKQSVGLHLFKSLSPARIRLACNKLRVTNALAYFAKKFCCTCLRTDAFFALRNKPQVVKFKFKRRHNNQMIILSEQKTLNAAKVFSK